jgi:hypothetical protein
MEASLKVNDLIEFLNNTDLQELNESIDELDKEVSKILEEKDAELGNIIVEETKNMSAEEFVWFAFLRANFLRGMDTISNNAFKQFVNYCKKEKNNYYFNEFPKGKFLPNFEKPKFQRAPSIEKVLQQLRDEYESGSNFVDEIKELASHTQISEIHELYLKLLVKLTSYKQIGGKIANAIIAEPLEEVRALSKNNVATVEKFLENEWLKNLLFASFFNVMVDTHVRNFFKEKLGFKDVEHSILIFIGKSMKPEVVKSLFERYLRYYNWLKEDEKESFLNNYREYIGACILEKMIWSAYYVQDKKRIDLKIVKLSNGLFKKPENSK